MDHIPVTWIIFQSHGSYSSHMDHIPVTWIRNGLGFMTSSVSIGFLICFMNPKRWVVSRTIFVGETTHQVEMTNCWWKKSCTSWYGEYPIIYRGFIHIKWCRISSINRITKKHVSSKEFPWFCVPGFLVLYHGNLRVPPLCHPPQEIRPY